MRQDLILLLLVFTVVFGCKKIESIPLCKPTIHKNYTYDTIKPSDYLMIYPGSWWKYSNGTSDSCFAWENVSIAEVFINGNCKATTEDMHVLPRSKFNGYISYESKVTSYANLQQTNFTPMVSETPGEIYYHKEIWSGYSGYQSTTVTSYGKLDSMTIGSTVFYDVVYMKEKHVTYYTGANGGPFADYGYYYAKGIGMIRRLQFYDQAGIPMDTMDLVDYYIAPH